MRKRSLKLVLSALLVTMISGVMVGCGNSNQSVGENVSGNAQESVKGSITVSGSSALLPLMEQSIEKFNDKYPEVEISAQAGGSGTGLTQVSDGTVNIGNSDVFAEDWQLY